MSKTFIIIISVVIILGLGVMGGIYFWQSKQDANSSPSVQIPAVNRDTTKADSQKEMTQIEVDAKDLDYIAKELDSTEFDSIDTELDLSVINNL